MASLLMEYNLRTIKMRLLPPEAALDPSVITVTE